jgi:hypothetical protein
MGPECCERTLGERRAHLAAIDKIVDRWHSGEISMAEKREAILHENTFYHGRAIRGRTGRSLTADTAEHAHVRSADDEDREQWWNR